jgi:hypothetical protein
MSARSRETVTIMLFLKGDLAGRWLRRGCCSPGGMWEPFALFVVGLLTEP